MKKRLLTISAVFAAVLSFSGCFSLWKQTAELRSGDAAGPTTAAVREEETAKSRDPETKERADGNRETTAEEKQSSKAVEETTRSAVRPEAINLNFKPGFHLAGTEYTPLQLSPGAPEYSINADLSNIENMGQFANLTQKQKEMIAQNGFVVIPTDAEQLFYIYEDNTYKKIPSFITTDSVLQLYHIFYDYSLRNLEADFFYQDLIRLNGSMLEQLIAEYSGLENEQVKENALKVIGYFGVANLSLGAGLPDNFPQELISPVQLESHLIEKAAGVAESPLLETGLDYSLFKVRGHYTRSAELEKYFRCMSWYGIVSMPICSDEGKVYEDSATQAIIATVALCRLPEEEGVKRWENIYSTTSFYVGEADDLTPYEIAQVVDRVYSANPDLNEIPQGLDDFFREMKQMRKPGIVHKIEGKESGLEMRFMGQRYIPDSEILQELSSFPERIFPNGLDVFAVFGSERAEELLDEFFQPARQWNKYEENFRKLKEKFAGQTIAQQTSNLYNGWLYSLKSLTVRPTEGYPLFMQNSSWEDKSLSTALGSWAEIRHDTILYGKQSAVECGGGEEPPPELTSYVEPNPEFFNRLLWQTTATREGLSERGMLGEPMRDKLIRFEEMLSFLTICAQKELNGEDLSVEEQYTLLTYGGSLEYLSSSIAEADNWHLVESDTDRNMAVIADVHTGGGSYLEVGVGTACEIYVAIPQRGKVYLTRGAVFDYYEFISDERLTDEAWQQQIKEAPPARPEFTGSYLDDVSGGEVPVPDQPYSTGC